MKTLRLANERGGADFGWLKSKHSFSFGSYYDEQFMGFSALRVINDDTVNPGAGFQTHGHQDMEIISYVLDGNIAHKDSEGNEAIIPKGEFQLMSAGSGIRHSEFNPSKVEPVHFLQIWIEPNVYGKPPSYQQKDFGQQHGLTLAVSPNGERGSLVVKQDAKLYQLLLDQNKEAELPANINRKYYVHLIAGVLDIDGTSLKPGDALMLQDISALNFKAVESTTALVFDLP